MSSRSSADASSNLNYKELAVDFLGILVPGLVFSAIVAGLCFLALFSVFGMASHHDDHRIAGKTASPAGNNYPPEVDTEHASVHGLSKEFKNILSLAPIESFFFVVVASYVVGQILHRMGPKKPDEASFNWLKNEDLKVEIARGSWAATNTGEAEYPYGNLKRYLEQRGMSYLSKKIPWEAAEQEHDKKENYFSQHFMNALHVRLRYFVPHKCWPVDRGEAHLQLISSTWYLSSILRDVSWIALIPAAANLFLSLWYGWQPASYSVEVSSHLLPGLLVLAILSMSWFVKHKIETFFHLQRVWSVVALLETAYIASLEEPRIFNGNVKANSDAPQKLSE